MSVSVMSWAWGLDIPTGEKMVLLALADRCNDDGQCWPGYASLAVKCSMSERNVMRMVARLEDYGLLSISQRKNSDNGRQKTNVYTLHSGSKPGDNLSPGNEQKPGDKCDKKPGDTMSPNTSVNQTPVLEVTTLRSVTSNTSAQSSSPPPEKPIEGIGFDAGKGQFTNITQEQYDKFDQAFTKIDVDAEIEKAELWLMANPKKRKQNYLRFLTGWFARATERVMKPAATFAAVKQARVR